MALHSGITTGVCEILAALGSGGSLLATISCLTFAAFSPFRSVRRDFGATRGVRPRDCSTDP
jgi:hypothetical protein